MARTPCPSELCCCADCLQRAASRVSFDRGCPNYAVLPGDDLDEALSLELVRRSSECECSPSSHWREDSQGNERRIVCGCGCEACSEF